MTHLSRRSFSGLFATAAISTIVAPHVASGQTRPRLVIVGGGFGGASASRYARLAFPGVDVTLIEPRTSFVTAPMAILCWLAPGPLATSPTATTG